MDQPPRTVAALFYNHEEANKAIEALISAGFPENTIGVAARPDEPPPEDVDRLDEPNAKGGAATGAAGGGLIGGIFGLLVGLGAIAIPGIGAILVGGVLGATLTGLGIGAASGGLVGALIGMGIHVDEANRIERGLVDGATVVTVEAGERSNEALEVLGKLEVTVSTDDTDRVSML